MADSTSSVNYTSTSGNMIRITGLNTGLDVDSMVKKLMTAEQTKIDKAKQAQQTIQWQQDAYKDIISSIQELQNTFFDVTSPDTNIQAATNFSPYSVTGADASVGTITASVGAKTGNYTLKVNNLASGAAYTNKLTSTDSSAVTLGTKLNLLDPALSGGSLNLTLNVNGSPTKITLDNTDGSKTVYDLVSAINTQSNGAINANYSELTGKLSVSTAKMGSSVTMSVDAATTPALAGIINPSNTASQSGQNASFVITEPGESPVTVTSQATNSFTYDGVTYNLAGAGTTTANVGVDTTAAYNKFSSFITKYNTVVDKIYTAMTDKKDSDYPALTDTQKASMTTDQINSWNAKAKVGVLHNDSKLQKMLSDLQQAFATPVSGVALQMGKYTSNSIGIDTSSDYTKPGEIHITDPNTFKNAIAQNSAQLMKLFTNVSSSTDKNTNYSESGIFQRVNNILVSNVGIAGTTSNSATLTQYASYQDSFSNFGSTGLNTLMDQLYQKKVLLTNLSTEFSTMQSKYYNQFSRLETAMQTLNSQSSSLTRMMG